MADKMGTHAGIGPQAIWQLRRDDPSSGILLECAVRGGRLGQACYQICAAPSADSRALAAQMCFTSLTSINGNALSWIAFYFMRARNDANTMPNRARAMGKLAANCAISEGVLVQLLHR